MHSLEDIASNRPHSKEEHWAWLKDQKQKMRPHCACLLAKENGTESMPKCLSLCNDYWEVLKARKKLKKSKE